MATINLVRSYLLNKDCFTFAVLQNLVALYDKANATKLHKKALAGDEYASEILKNMGNFDQARMTILQHFLQVESNDCLEALCTAELIEEYDLKGKCLLVCSKKRGNTRCFIIHNNKKELYRAFFYLHHFPKIIREQYLGYLKRPKMKVAILTSLTYDMWYLFAEKVVLLSDYIHNNQCLKRK